MEDTEVASEPSRHPVTVARESLGMTRSQLAMACRISYFTLSQVESGLIQSVPKALLKLFREAGVDTRALLLAVAIWREEQSREVADALKRSTASRRNQGTPRARASELESIIEMLGSLTAPR